MGMVVRTNVMAMNANRQLGINNTQVGKSLEKLSSGFRINRAADDASGLAISEKMKAQIKGLETASANSQDGISLIQTAEGGAQEIHDMLNRMVELATKSANGTIQNDVDREAIQREVDDLNSEISRIAQSTNFNGINLLDGTLGAEGTKTAKFNGVTVSGLGDAVKSFDLVFSSTGTAGTDEKAVFDTKTGKLTVTVVGASTSGNIQTALQKAFGSGVTATGTAAAFVAGSAGAIDLTKPSAAGSIAGTRGAGFSINVSGKTGITSLQITSAAGTEKITKGAATAITLDDTKNYTAADINKLLQDADVKGISVDFTGSLTSAQVATGLGVTGVSNVTDGAAGGLTLQVGDTNDSFNKVSVSVDDLSAQGIGTASVNVSNQDAAGNSIKTIKSAINKVSTNRANLGSLQNRLEHTINNLDTTAENMTAANSRIRDTDMAKEMMNYTKMNILTQAAQAMLAQANQQPQSILQLLQ